MGKLITEEQFFERIKQNHPFSNIKILEYTKITARLIYQCLKCNKIHQLKRADEIFNRLNPCDCHKDFYSRKEKLMYFENKQDILKIIELGTNKTKIYCNNCGNTFERENVHLLYSFNTCPYCNNGYRKQTNTIPQAEIMLKQYFPNTEYKILIYTKYHGYCEIEHTNCHFVYKGNFDSFLNSRGCPRCYRKLSKGEQYIEAFLKERQLVYISQAPLDLETSMKRYKFDFFIPQYNLAIEYNGEQHYIQKKDRFDSLAVTQSRDLKKIQYCQRHNIELLIIPYWDRLKIPTILSSKFNDYRNQK